MVTTTLSTLVQAPQNIKRCRERIKPFLPCHIAPLIQTDTVDLLPIVKWNIPCILPIEEYEEGRKGK